MKATIVTGRYRMRGSIRMSSSSVIPQHETTACGSAQVQIEGSVCTGVLPSCTLLPQPKTIGNINLSPNGDEYRTLLTKLRNNFINPFSLIFTSNLLQPYIKTEFSKLSEGISRKILFTDYKMNCCKLIERIYNAAANLYRSIARQRESSK